MEWVAITILGFLVFSAHMMLRDWSRQFNKNVDINANEHTRQNQRIYELEKRVEKLEKYIDKMNEEKRWLN